MYLTKKNGNIEQKSNFYHQCVPILIHCSFFSLKDGYEFRLQQVMKKSFAFHSNITVYRVLEMDIIAHFETAITAVTVFKHLFYLWSLGDICGCSFQRLKPFTMYCRAIASHLFSSQLFTHQWFLHLSNSSYAETQGTLMQCGHFSPVSNMPRLPLGVPHVPHLVLKPTVYLTFRKKKQNYLITVGSENKDDWFQTMNMNMNSCLLSENCVCVWHSNPDLCPSQRSRFWKWIVPHCLFRSSETDADGFALQVH